MNDTGEGSTNHIWTKQWKKFVICEDVDDLPAHIQAAAGAMKDPTIFVEIGRNARSKGTDAPVYDRQHGRILFIPDDLDEDDCSNSEDVGHGILRPNSDGWSLPPNSVFVAGLGPSKKIVPSTTQVHGTQQPEKNRIASVSKKGASGAPLPPEASSLAPQQTVTGSDCMEVDSVTTLKPSCSFQPATPIVPANKRTPDSLHDPAMSSIAINLPPASNSMSVDLGFATPSPSKLKTNGIGAPLPPEVSSLAPQQAVTGSVCMEVDSVTTLEPSCASRPATPIVLANKRTPDSLHDPAMSSIAINLPPASNSMSVDLGFATPSPSKLTTNGICTFDRTRDQRRPMPQLPPGFFESQRPQKKSKYKAPEAKRMKRSHSTMRGDAGSVFEAGRQSSVSGSAVQPEGDTGSCNAQTTWKIPERADHSETDGEIAYEEILGVQLSRSAKAKLFKCNGKRYHLPFFDVDSVHLIEDINALGLLAAEARPAREDKEGCCFLPFSRDLSLVRSIQRSLAKGMMVVITNVPERSAPVTFSRESIERCAFSEDDEIDVHDALKRDENRNGDQMDIHTTLTFRDFVEKADQPTCCYNLLDNSFLHADTPWFVSELDSSKRAWRSSYKVGGRYKKVSKKAPQLEDAKPAAAFLDDIKQREWQLWTHAGFLTHEHHDASGLCTYMEVKSGEKLWFYVREEVKEGMSLDDWLRSRAEDAANGNYATIPLFGLSLTPGSVLIQPPSTRHVVYTPVKTVCNGGHFLNINCLHLTEYGRRIDCMNKSRATNAEHLAVPRMIDRLAMVVSSSKKPIRRDALRALCRMVLTRKDCVDSSGIEYTEHQKSTSVLRLCDSLFGEAAADAHIAAKCVKKVMEKLGWKEKDLLSDYSAVKATFLDFDSEEIVLSA